jgi:hypothetical protein
MSNLELDILQILSKCLNASWTFPDSVKLSTFALEIPLLLLEDGKTRVPSEVA